MCGDLHRLRLVRLKLVYVRYSPKDNRIKGSTMNQSTEPLLVASPSDRHSLPCSPSPRWGQWRVWH